jgi:hydroxypyruvate isomerase
MKCRFAKLISLNYQGFIGLEYKPLSSSLESLAWLLKETKN